MASFKKRIAEIEEALKDDPAKMEVLTISREAYNSLDPIQQLNLPMEGVDKGLPMHSNMPSNLPFLVRIEISEKEKEMQEKFFNGEITQAELSNFHEEHEENEHDFSECVEKYGGFEYDWDENVLRDLVKD